MFVGEGWNKFAKTYGLEENCLLMFKYTQNPILEVLIFDPDSLCEKECGLENHTKRSVRVDSRTEPIEDGDSDFTSRKKSKKDVEGVMGCLQHETGNHMSNVVAKDGRMCGRMETPHNSLVQLIAHGSKHLYSYLLSFWLSI
ncbi:B3 domain-containing protein At4g01580-like [Amaranthus tricolor]|uniref:B3 domain-containing protein At4g01580-like n=1 Tax=Amaranthus tricolor TaxID=29722 RepID=UPI0025899AF8|nr:B3 domain-containing protein At4g01580-like [Amaranthus tricolor]